MNTLKAETQLADFTRDKRLILLSLPAVAIGCVSTVVVEVLVELIAVMLTKTAKA